jgi:hypothetical protein
MHHWLNQAPVTAVALGDVERVYAFLKNLAFAISSAFFFATDAPAASRSDTTLE